MFKDLANPHGYDFGVMGTQLHNLLETLFLTNDRQQNSFPASY